jgi:hypothetical protein
MISIGFENLYHGEGWGDGYLLYSTYDFQVGSEFDRFANLEDWKNFQVGKLADSQPISGANGFSRIQVGISYGKVPVYKTYIYPKENGYLALVYTIGAYEDDFESKAGEFKKGIYPPDKQADIALFDRIAGTLKLK